MPNTFNIVAIIVFLIPYLALSVKKVVISCEADDWAEMIYRSGIATFIAWVAMTRWLVQGYGLFALPKDHFVLGILLSDLTALFMILMLPATWLYFLYDRKMSGDSLEAVHLVDSIKRKIVAGRTTVTFYRLAMWAFYFRVVVIRIATEYVGGFDNLPKNNAVYNTLVGDEIFLIFSVAVSISYIIYLFTNQYRAAKREALYN